MIIGITGPIGSGKDEVCKILKRYGAKIIDADKIGHKILGRGINRKKLGDEVFADKKKLKKLNAVLHPRIKKEIIDLLLEGQVAFVGINAALLKEIRLIELCDEVWVVMAPKAERIRRLLKKRRDRTLFCPYDRKKINNIMKRQMSQKGYLKIADKIIWNKGSMKGLRKIIEGTARELSVQEAKCKK